MFGPDWEEGCKSCSFWADNFNGIPIHLNHRDVTFTAVSRAPLAKINAYKKRMGWSFPWVSSYGSDFSFDYHVSFTPEQIAEGKAYYNLAVAGMTGRSTASRSWTGCTGKVASLTTHEATVDRCRANVDAAATPSAGFQNQSVFAAF
jgi:predicted dithiol-disulfide oxidoreductase (DUF899 family)